MADDQPVLTDEQRTELTRVARRWIQGEVYVGFVDPDHPVEFAAVWPVIAVGLSSGELIIAEDTVGAWQELAQASMRSVNGRPMFFSCHLLRRHEAQFLLEKAQRMQEALDGA